MPSMKVVTQLLVSLVAGLGTWAPIVIGAVAAYFKAETNPAPSSFDQPK